MTDDIVNAASYADGFADGQFAQRQRIKALEAENKIRWTMEQKWQARADAAEKECSTLTFKLTEAMAALRPFANAATNLDPTNKDEWDLYETAIALDIQVRDLRRALTVLAKLEYKA